MKFSEAIRIGCILRPRQVFGSFVEYEDGACALVAARVALGQGDYDRAYRSFLTVNEASCPVCPVAGERGYNITCTIAHLNDHHMWSRERIADWVEIQEKIQERIQEKNTDPETDNKKELALTLVIG